LVEAAALGALGVTLLEVSGSGLAIAAVLCEQVIGAPAS
jgi:hypothetical protein